MVYFMLRDHFTVKRDTIINKNESKATKNNSSLVGGFSKKKLLKMCAFAAISYGSNDSELSKSGYKTKAEFINKGYTIIPFYYSDKRLAGVAFAKDKKIYIAYHGTMDFNDVITDLNSLFTMPSFLQNGERVHKGFYNAFLNSFNSLDSALENYTKTKNLELKDCKIAITGHSMGGAIAKIAALYFRKIGKIQDIHVATFGDPRTFDIIASATYNSVLAENTIRVAQYSQDPVTATPPIWFGYSHVGELLKVKALSIANLHKLTSYYHAGSNIEKENFKSDNSRALSHYLAGAFHLFNCGVLGGIHYIVNNTMGNYFSNEVELSLSRKAAQKNARSPSTSMLHCTKANAGSAILHV